MNRISDWQVWFQSGIVWSFCARLEKSCAVNIDLHVADFWSTGECFFALVEIQALFSASLALKRTVSAGDDSAQSALMVARHGGSCKQRIISCLTDKPLVLIDVLFKEPVKNVKSNISNAPWTRNNCSPKVIGQHQHQPSGPNISSSYPLSGGDHTS